MKYILDKMSLLNIHWIIFELFAVKFQYCKNFNIDNGMKITHDILNINKNSNTLKNKIFHVEQENLKHGRHDFNKFMPNGEKCAEL